MRNFTEIYFKYVRDRFSLLLSQPFYTFCFQFGPQRFALSDKLGRRGEDGNLLAGAIIFLLLLLLGFQLK